MIERTYTIKRSEIEDDPWLAEVNFKAWLAGTHYPSRAVLSWHTDINGDQPYRLTWTWQDRVYDQRPRIFLVCIIAAIPLLLWATLWLGSVL